MKNFTIQGFGLSLKWVTILQSRHLVRMFFVQVAALLLLLFLFTQNWLLPDSGDGSVPDASFFQQTEFSTMSFSFLLLAPFMIVGTLHSLLSAHSRQFHLMMPATPTERYSAHMLLALAWLLIAYPLSFFIADLLRWLVFAAFGKGSLGMILTFHNPQLPGLFHIEDSTDAMFLSAWLLYVTGGWWCALFFNKSWLIAFGFFCVAYPCLFVMPFLAISSIDVGSQFYIGLNLLLLAFITWHSWRLFRYKRMKRQ